METTIFCIFTPRPGLFTFQGVVGDDEFRVAVFGTFIITNLVYWTVGSIYSYFDISGTPEFLRKYKVCTDGVHGVCIDVTDKV